MHILKTLLSCIAPHFCPLCGASSNQYLCKHCIDSFTTATNPCMRCAIPLPQNANGSHTTECAECLLTPPLFAQTICAFEYRHSVISAISKFKNAGDLNIAKSMTDKLTTVILQRYANETLPEIVISVPIHWRRRWNRGFNQSELIAKQLARSLDLTYVNALKKHTATTPQKHLNRAERQRNLSESFLVKERLVRNKHIVIVDDVITTASTIKTLSELCALAGASRIDIWALARTPKYESE